MDIILKKGIIQPDGMVKGEDGKLYEPDMIYKNTVLLVCSSWSRYDIKDVKGKKVMFLISPKGHAYNFKLMEDEKRR